MDEAVTGSGTMLSETHIQDLHVHDAVVITCSNRASAGVYDDVSGPLLVEWLRGLGFEVADPVVVPDGEPVRAALQEAIDRGAAVVLTTGGTGLTPTDQTPEVTRELLDREIPQLSAAIAQHGVGKGVATATLSRGLAGVAGSTLVVNLPGSKGGVKDAMEVLEPVLHHAVSQIHGGDHA